jgi:hypothetical protein
LSPYAPECVEGVSLLKKSLLNRSVVQNRIQTLRYQRQNTAMAGFSFTGRRPGRGVEGFFNRLGYSPKLDFRFTSSGKFTQGVG